MLASPIQSGTSYQTSNSAATITSPAPAESTAIGNAVANASSTEQKKSPNSNPESVNELFSGQLDDVLISTEQFGAVQADGELFQPESASEQSQQQSQQQGQQQQEPNAEEWLMAMLDQQQLQLQARDTLTTPVNIITAPQLLADAVASAGSQATVSVITIEKLVNEKSALPFTADNVLSKAQINIVNAAEKDLNKSGELSLKNTVNSLMSVATANAMPATDARATDSGNATSTNVSASAAMNASTTLVTPQANVAAITEIGHNSSVVPVALSAAGDDSVQRSAQSQLSLHTPEAKWGEQILHALRDNVQVQIQQRIQNATIRLDPPELGSLEIYLSHEAGRLNVHITASQSDVARLIQQTSDRLRHELAGPQFTQVNVQTSADGQGGQQHSRERQRLLTDDLILANEQVFVNNDQPGNRASDVLVTV